MLNQVGETITAWIDAFGYVFIEHWMALLIIAIVYSCVLCLRPKTFMVAGILCTLLLVASSDAREYGIDGLTMIDQGMDTIITTVAESI